MSRRRTSDTLPFDTLRLEGSLFVPELLERAARGGATAQQETDYDIPKGLKLHDEYGRAFRIAGALWQDFAAQRPRADLNATTFTRHFVIDFLRQTLGYDDLAALGEPVVIGDRGFPVTAQALGGRLPVIIAPHHLGLDDPDPAFAIQGSGAKKKSAHQLAQEYLNAAPAALWAIVSNGRSLRLLRDAETLTRPNFLEFDLETILGEGEDHYADYSALWRILHASRSGDRHAPSSSPADCIWEQWKGEGHAQGLRVREGLRVGVTQALLVLGSGFVAHPDNKVFRERLGDGSLTTDAFFQQLLRLVYRWLFLFCAEERELLHAPLPDDPQESESARSAREAYTRGYGLRRLRSRSLRRLAHDPHGDLWISLRIAFRSLASGEPRLALPALGGLFADSQCPDIDAASLSNRDLLAAMRELRWFFDKKSGRRSAIDYRNMGPEELGSVYESLLELVPQLDLPARTFGFAGISDESSTSGNARKTSGSYYTPDSLVQELIKSALEPVIRQRLAEARALADQPWSSVAREIATDPVKQGYVRAYLEKQAALAVGTPLDALGRAWEAIPAVARANPLCAEALLALTVCDPSCGSGHFLLAAARRLAERLAELRAPDGAVRPDDYRHALREVASRCLYGVDINPMAVELCRVALWLETVDPGKPLGFLDHHIRCGNSLLGTTPELVAEGLPDDTFKAIEGDDKTACAELKKRNKKEREGFGPLFEKEEQSIRDRLRQAATQIEAMDDSRPDALQQKEAAFATSETAPEYRHAKLLADLWCAAFVIKKTYPASDEAESAISDPASQIPPPIEGQLLHTQDELFGPPTPAPAPAKKTKQPRTKNKEPGTASGITTGTLRNFVQGQTLPEALEKEVVELASQYRFFHWHLAFPQVFERGGFDCILGNPPWERVKLQEKEWFTEHRPDIADAPNAAARKRMIEKIAVDDPRLFAAFCEDVRSAEGESHFARSSGRFPLCGNGDINTFAVFTESMRDAVAPKGRIGCIVPSGIATDETKKHFVREVTETKTLTSLFQFLNKGFFPGVRDAQGNRFCLLTLTGSGLSVEQPDFVFSAWQMSDLAEPDRHFSLTAEDVMLLNPNTRTLPIFQCGRDAEITKFIYRSVPVLSREDQIGNKLWEVSFMRMLDMANDSDVFHTSDELHADGATLRGNVFVLGEQYWVPLYEAKMFHHFEHRFGDYALAPLTDKEVRQIPQAPPERLSDATYVVLSRYWIPKQTIEQRLGMHWMRGWFLGFRDVCSSVDVRTVISSILPWSGVGHTAPLMFPSSVSPSLISCLYSCLSSFVFDYVARQKVGGTHLTYTNFNQLPVLPPATYAEPCAWSNQPAPLRDWVFPRVLELTYTAWDLEPFAQDCGWPGPPFRWDEERRFLLRCELDAAFFHLYLGPESEWQQQPEALTRSFPTPRDAVSYIMDTFPIVKRKDEAKHGSYRTKDTILQIYDALGEAMETGVPYQTLLNPPPASFRVAHLPRLPETPRLALTQARSYWLEFLVVTSRLAGDEFTFDLLWEAYLRILSAASTVDEVTSVLGDDAEIWLESLGAEPLDRGVLPDLLESLESEGLLTVSRDGGALVLSPEIPGTPDLWRCYDAAAALMMLRSGTKALDFSTGSDEIKQEAERYEPLAKRLA